MNNPNTHKDQSKRLALIASNSEIHECRNDLWEVMTNADGFVGDLANDIHSKFLPQSAMGGSIYFDYYPDNDLPADEGGDEPVKMAFQVIGADVHDLMLEIWKMYSFAESDEDFLEKYFKRFGKKAEGSPEEATSSALSETLDGGTLNKSSKEDYDNAYQFRFELTEWLLDKGITVDTEMLSIFVGWDGGKPAPLYTSRELVVKVLPRDAYMESQWLWDMYCLSKTEDEFIEKFKEWRTHVRQMHAVDEADNVVPISEGEAL